MLYDKEKRVYRFFKSSFATRILKRTYNNVWAQCAAEIVRTSKSKFRKYGDIAPWLIRYWQLTSNSFSPLNPYKDGVFYLLEDNNISEVVNCILRQRKRIICLNDSEQIASFDEAWKRIVDAFKIILPDKSSFEM